MDVYVGVRRSVCGAVVLAALAGCGGTQLAVLKPKDQFAIERQAGTELVRLRLEAGVPERLQLKLRSVAAFGAPGAGVGSRALPYPALLYKPDGSTFVYTNPEPGVYVHQPVTVDRVDGEVAVISAGPDTGTPVVTDGAAELMGMEFGVGK
jgi:hypothetical protein